MSDLQPGDVVTYRHPQAPEDAVGVPAIVVRLATRDRAFIRFDATSAAKLCPVSQLQKVEQP